MKSFPMVFLLATILTWGHMTAGHAQHGPGWELFAPAGEAEAGKMDSSSSVLEDAVQPESRERITGNTAEAVEGADKDYVRHYPRSRSPLTEADSEAPADNEPPLVEPIPYVSDPEIIRPATAAVRPGTGEIFVIRSRKDFEFALANKIPEILFRGDRFILAPDGSYKSPEQLMMERLRSMNRGAEMAQEAEDTTFEEPLEANRAPSQPNPVYPNRAPSYPYYPYYQPVYGWNTGVPAYGYAVPPSNARGSGHGSRTRRNDRDSSSRSQSVVSPNYLPPPGYGSSPHYIPPPPSVPPTVSLHGESSTGHE